MFVHHAFLEPKRFGSNLGGFIDNGADILWLSKHIDKIDWNRDSCERRIGSFSQDALSLGVDGDDTEPLGLHIFGDMMGGAIRIGREPYHSNGSTVSQDPLDGDGVREGGAVCL
jgi:hypothetical protein